MTKLLLFVPLVLAYLASCAEAFVPQGEVLASSLRRLRSIHHQGRVVSDEEQEQTTSSKETAVDNLNVERLLSDLDQAVRDMAQYQQALLASSSDSSDSSDIPSVAATVKAQLERQRQPFDQLHQRALQLKSKHDKEIDELRGAGAPSTRANNNKGLAKPTQALATLGAALFVGGLVALWGDVNLFVPSMDQQWALPDMPDMPFLSPHQPPTTMAPRSA